MRVIAFDTETTGTDFHHGCKPFMFTACDGENNYLYQGTVNPKDRSQVDWEPFTLELIESLLDSADQIVCHNAKFDIRALDSIGIKYKDEWWEITEDTMIASHLLSSGDSHALKYLAFKYLGYNNEDEQSLHDAVIAARASNPHLDIARKGHKCFPGLDGPGANWYKMDYWLCPDECAKYACDDVEMTYLLWDLFKKVITKEKLWEQYETRRELLKITYDMETNGLHVYVDELVSGIELLEQEIEEHREFLQEKYKFTFALNLNSEEHVRILLFTAMGLKPTEFSDKTGKPLTNKFVIEKFSAQNPEHEGLQTFISYKTAVTQKQYYESYLKWLCDDSRLRSNVLITGTRETRQATRNPNIQNIGKKYRHVLGPPPGYVWLDYDLVNVELRIWTYCVGNKKLLDVFESGGSVHLLIAAILYPDLYQQCEDEGEPFNIRYKATLYQWVKNGNFAIIYGATPYTANRSYKHDSAFQLISQKFPEVPLFAEKCAAEMLHNYKRYNSPFVTCIGGYRLEVNPNDPHKATNYKIQGTAGYIINLAMIEIVNSPLFKATSSKIVNQVHDSIIIEIPAENNTEEVQQEYKTCIERAGKKLLPSCDADFEIKYPLN